MSVSYVARKCSQCAGKLEHIKEKKIWKCLYCGAEIERTEQYSGLFTINNVVRQVLLNVAYRRLDSAQKDLIECEKIDSRYIGTYIAKIAFQMITAITPGGCPEGEIRNFFSQVKRNYEALCAINKGISDEEESLYEFIENDDVNATLVLVYDSLNDTTRRDFIANLLNAEQVFAKEPNKNLLGYALKYKKYDLVDKIINNSENIDVVFTLNEILQKYPDDENKFKCINLLLKAQNFKPEDKRLLDDYLASSADSPPTKGLVIGSFYAANIRTDLEKLITFLSATADFETVEYVLRQVCCEQLSDDDAYKIVEFAISAENSNVSATALNVLRDSGKYVMMPSKYIISLLSRSDLAADDKVLLLKIMLSFNVDAKSKEAVINNYLCFNNDKLDIRLEVVPALLDTVSVIQTNTVEKYVLSTDTDGENKPLIVEKIFTLDLNKSFFNDLISKYMNSSDSSEIKEKIINILVDKGLKIDPNSFISYLCKSADTAENKARLTKKLLACGMQLRGDTVSSYLESISTENSGKFDKELFALIANSATSISERALSSYLLFCKDSDTSKTANTTAFAGICNRNIVDVTCQVSCAGQSITSNLLQAYILATPDRFEVAKNIADLLLNKKVKLNSEIKTDTGFVKFRKFVAKNQGGLNPVTEQLCAVYKI